MKRKIETLIRKLVVLTIFIGFSLSIAIPLVNAQEGEVTINPIADTYVDSNNPDSNYGGQSYLHISKYEFLGGVFEKRIWLKFNLSSVPDGAIVDNAILRLYCTILSETYTVYAHASSDTAWNEYTLTWSNMPSYNNTPMDVTYVSTDYTWYSWNVTYAVRESVDGIHGGSDMVTIVLLETTLRSSFSSAWFYSKEESFLDKPPELTVHWSGIVPEFQSPIVLPLLMIATLLVIILCKQSQREKSPKDSFVRFGI